MAENSTICDICGGFIASWEPRITDGGNDYHPECVIEETEFANQAARFQPEAQP